MTYDTLTFTDRTGRKCYTRHLPTAKAHRYTDKLSGLFTEVKSTAEICFIPEPDRTEITEKELKELIRQYN